MTVAENEDVPPFQSRHFGFEIAQVAQDRGPVLVFSESGKTSGPEVGRSAGARRVQHRVRLDDRLAARSRYERAERSLGAERMAGELAPRQAGAPERHDAVPRPDASGENRMRGERLENLLDHLAPEQKAVGRRCRGAEQIAYGRGHIHLEGSEEPRRAPAAERLADAIALEDGDVEPSRKRLDGGDEARRTGPDDEEPPCQINPAA
jgi:hypothetical protein